MLNFLAKDSSYYQTWSFQWKQVDLPCPCNLRHLWLAGKQNTPFGRHFIFLRLPGKLWPEEATESYKYILGKRIRMYLLGFLLKVERFGLSSIRSLFSGES